MLTAIPQPICSEPPPLNQKQQATNTIQYGIQVDLNINPESLQIAIGNQNEEKLDPKQGLSHTERRKLAKKQAKKRKKEKTQEMQREARRQIGNIIQQLYERGSHFEDYSGKIQTLVELVYNNDFRDYLDQLIRMRVNYIQKDIWEYTQSIMDENPFETSEDNAFYGMMVEYIHDHFVELEESSKEIEKIINIYLKYTYKHNDNREEIVYNNLAVNTFNYMIETDETLRNLLHICDKKLSPTRQRERKKLEELLYIVDSYYQDNQERSEEDQSSSVCPSDQYNSTGISEEDDALFEKKKKRRKVKESELTTNEESLTRRLEALAVKETDRNPCRISEDSLTRLRLRAIKYKMSGM